MAIGLFGVDRADEPEDGAGSGTASDGRPDRSGSPDQESAAVNGPDGEPSATPTQRSPRPKPKRPGKPASPPTVKPKAIAHRHFFVSRVIDGDTLELGNGASVRLVGIDTPEVGECGFDRATANLERLVLGRQVRLRISDEDTDRYGRLLRYVDVGAQDAGLRLIKNGVAVARYDSRDGYGFHPREPAYVAADRASRNVRCATSPPSPRTFAGGGCAAGYRPCIPPFPPDLDCADVDGPIQVTGTDPHGLDGEGDGIACE